MMIGVAPFRRLTLRLHDGRAPPLVLPSIGIPVRVAGWLVALGLCVTAGPRAAWAAPLADWAAPLVNWGSTVPPWLILVFCVVGALTAGVGLYWARGQRRLHDAIFAAVPSPRQAVNAKGEVIFANPSFYRSFGRTNWAIPDLILEQIVGDAEARDLIERLRANAQNGISGQLEVAVPAKAAGEGGTHDGKDDGGEAEQPEWRLLAAFPVSGHPGVVYWSVDDITSRRQVEQVIRDEQERFVDLLEHAPIGFYSVDEQGCFLFVNRTLMEWLQVSHEDLEAGRIRLHDVIANPMPDGCPPYSPFGDADSNYGEVTLKTASGVRFNASVNQDMVRSEDGKALRTRSVVRDLSRERAMAEALERSEERFERFFEEAPVGIVLLDPAGDLTECNPAFCRLVNREAQALRRAPLLDFIKPPDQGPLKATLERLRVSEGGAAAQAPLEVHMGEDEEIICSLYMTKMEGESGQLLGFIAHFIDSTEQKKLEVQFAQSQKMQAVGQLAGGIAHDFNNLLTAMIGFSDLLLLRHRPGDQSFADIMQVKQNANRAANLVRQLLAFSRQQTLQPRRLNITNILAEIAHLLRRLIGENIELKILHGRDLGLVKADHGQLEQVIINLAVNARDAMTGAGTLTIRTANETLKRERKSKGEGEAIPAGDYVVVEVSDTGSGIAADHLDRIFDPFFSTKQVGEGTGLGLSTVYGIVKQSGGYVLVDSKEGKGTTFRIYLPHVDPAEEEAEAAEQDTAERRDLTGHGTLLLVEDEDAVRSFGARALRNKGYNVLEANSGETAIEVMREEGKRVDLIITDVVMPRLDGPGLIKQVRSATPEIKVIYISGYTEDAFRKSLGEDSGIHFLPKPFSLKQLASKVKEVLEV